MSRSPSALAATLSSLVLVLTTMGIESPDDQPSDVSVDWSGESPSELDVEVREWVSDRGADNAGRDQTPAGEVPTEPWLPPIPSGSRPEVSQSAGIDFGPTLPDCGVVTPETGTVSCYDPESREAFYVPPGTEEAPETEQDDTEDEGPPVVTGAEIGEAIRAHTATRIQPAPLILQPDQDWHLVNLAVIVRTEPATQHFSAELLGLGVDIRAEPVSYSWDFGDGTPVLNTTDIGAPYPDHTIEHTYTHSGHYQITLITYWSGSFRVQGGPWIDIDGLGITATYDPTQNHLRVEASLNPQVVLGACPRGSGTVSPPPLRLTTELSLDAEEQ